MPTVSILTPVRNGSNYLTACIQSVLSQTFTDWEMIIINDHSTDDSHERCTAFQLSDSRIKIFNNTGKGIIAALNMALRKAEGHFVTRMDSDDMMPKKRLQWMVDSLIKHESMTIVTGLVRYFSDQPISAGYQRYEQWINAINLRGTQWTNIYRECVIASPNWMMRRKELISYRLFDNLSYPEDYDLTLRWYQHKFTVVTIPKVTLMWREHALRTSRTSSNYNQASFFRLKIAAFIKHEWNQKLLIVWGKNDKSQLMERQLKEHDVPFQNHHSENYRLIEKHRNSQLLIAVYPNPRERKQIEDYLTSIKFSPGRNWWYV